MRRAHWFAIGFQFAAMVLFAWAELWVFVGWCAAWGAYSSWRLRATRDKPHGIRA